MQIWEGTQFSFDWLQTYLQFTRFKSGCRCVKAPLIFLFFGDDLRSRSDRVEVCRTGAKGFITSLLAYFSAARRKFRVKSLVRRDIYWCVGLGALPHIREFLFVVSFNWDILSFDFVLKNITPQALENAFRCRINEWRAILIRRFNELSRIRGVMMIPARLLFRRRRNRYSPKCALSHTHTLYFVIIFAIRVLKNSTTVR